jgi:ubiquinone/menaquinone biosynthesis C-methylase UbiE
MSKPLYSAEPVDAEVFQDHFDRIYTRTARVYDIAVKLLPFWKAWLRQAVRHIRGSRVLEVSFGTGYLLTQYAGRFEIHGIDLNARLVSVALANLRSKGLKATLLRGNVEHLPYWDGYFDTVVNTMAFSGYPRGARAMAEMRRVLRPGGRLLLIDVNYPEDGNWVGVCMTRLWQRGGDIIRDMDSVLTAHGFEYEEREIGGFGSVHMYLCQRN